MANENPHDTERSPLLVAPGSTAPSHTPAKRVWSFCADGSQIYMPILISTCFVAASDPLIRSSLISLYINILCCQQEPTKCHDRVWCDTKASSSIESNLSTLYKWQSIFNAVGGATSVSIWFWGVWPWLQRKLPQGEKDMTRPMILSQAGFFLCEIVNALVAYAAWNGQISIAKFQYLVIYGYTVSFIVGGGPATYWVFRENIIAAALVRSHVDYPENSQVQLRNRNRQTAYITLSVSAVLSQLLSGQLNKWMVATNPDSKHTLWWCLAVGLVSYAIGITFLLFLPMIPRPSNPKGSYSAHDNNRQTASSQPSTSYLARIKAHIIQDIPSLMTRDRMIATLVILSGMASRPLAISVSSSFAILYISRRLHFDTSNAVVLTYSANIIPPLLPVVSPYLRSAVRNICDRLNIDVSNHVVLSLICPPPTNNVSASSSRSKQVRVSLSDISWTLAFLATAVVGTGMMAVSSGISLSQNYYLVLLAIILVCIGSGYPLYMESILAGWSAEKKKPSYFVFQQIVNATFLTLGAWLLNWGFQRELNDGQHGKGHIGWTYLVIMMVCIAAGLLLIVAVVLSSDATSQQRHVRSVPGVDDNSATNQVP